jgi:hypothetical protein
MAIIKPIRHKLHGWFFCLECKEMEYFPTTKTCLGCGNFLIPLEEKIDRDTARIRERIAKHGVQKATAHEGKTHGLHSEGINLALYLTAPERA